MPYSSYERHPTTTMTITETSAAFAPSLPIQTRRAYTTRTARYTPRCTLAPERSVSEPKSKKPTTKSYRILPDDTPKQNRPPLPPKHWSVPVVGFVLEYALGISKSFTDMRKKYGKIFRADYFLFPQTYVNAYQGVSEILNDAEVFRSHSTFPSTEVLFGKDTITQIDGKPHAEQRAMLAPAFSTRLLPYYFRRVAERTLDTWERVYNEVKTGKNVKLEPLFREHYLGITIEMTTGVPAGTEASSELRQLFSTMQLAFLTPAFGPIWNNGVRASEKIRDILADIVRDVSVRRADTIEKLREYGDDVVKLGLKDISRGDVDVLLVAIAESGLATGPDATLDPEIVANLCRQMILLFFAGYATAAVTSTCASFEMGWDDVARSALVSEQDELVAAANGDRSVTYEQLSNMPRLEAYLNEVLRTHPAASGLFRRTAKDVEMFGKFIPKDTVIFASIKAAQMDPDVWPDAERFDPERFLYSEDKRRCPPLLAFGGTSSPHFCIGAAMAKMMMKNAFATLLREYEYTLDPKQSRNFAIVPEEVPKSGVVLERFDKRE